MNLPDPHYRLLKPESLDLAGYTCYKKTLLMPVRYNCSAACIVTVLLLLVISFSFPIQAQPINIRVHDPVMIKQDSVYYLFCTGRGISVWSSVNRTDWKREEPVFSTPPDWAVKAVPGYRGHTWAPDISYHNGLYYLYYSVSTFGSNTSCIGVATNTTLHPSATGYKWEDHGMVIQSRAGRDRWNAIDPNLVMDDSNTPWLAFGSFWNGLQLVKLNTDRLSVATPLEQHLIAGRRVHYQQPDTITGDGAIEAPFIFRKSGYYYLFASIDYCCKGVNSTYKMIVGRSSTITGPYVDRQGNPLAKSGGTILLQGDQDWHGVGHNAVYTFDGKDYLIYHGYDAHDNGRAKLIIRELDWDAEGWPVVSPRFQGARYKAGSQN